MVILYTFDKSLCFKSNFHLIVILCFLLQTNLTWPLCILREIQCTAIRSTNPKFLLIYPHLLKYAWAFTFMVCIMEILT